MRSRTLFLLLSVLFSGCDKDEPNLSPTIEITSPGNNTTFEDSDNVKIEVSANDPDGIVKKVEFFNGATKLNEDLLSPFEFTWSNAPIGAANLVAIATDDKGATTMSSTIVIQIQDVNAPPQVSLALSNASNEYMEGVEIDITASANDPDGSIVKVEFYNGAVKLGEDATTPYNFTLQNTEPGTLQLLAKATDNENGTSVSEAIPVIVNSYNSLLEIRGADMSFLPDVRSSGISFKNSANQAESMLSTLKNAGVNMIRLRLWHGPVEATSSFTTVRNLTKEIQNLGMKVCITVHYSDDWADPATQAKPHAWNDLTFDVLKDSLAKYTEKIAKVIKPDYIQIGNEINGGLLWPDGHSYDVTKMKQLLSLGIAAVRENAPSTKIIIHFAGHEYASSFFSALSGLDYDLAGISYYPLWHGKDLNILRQNLSAIKVVTGKPVFIAETSYPFTLGWNDNTNNVIGSEQQILTEFPPTPEGQKKYLNAIKKLMTEVSGGAGYCYWGAEWVAFKGNAATNGSTWENQAFWDFDNRALPVIGCYR